MTRPDSKRLAGPIGGVYELIEDEYGIRFSAKIDDPEAFQALMYGMLGGSRRRSWWHRFLIWLGFPHSGPYTHTFTPQASFGFDLG